MESNFNEEDTEKITNLQYSLSFVVTYVRKWNNYTGALVCTLLQPCISDGVSLFSQSSRMFTFMAVDRIKTLFQKFVQVFFIMYRASYFITHFSSCLFFLACKTFCRGGRGRQRTGRNRKKPYGSQCIGSQYQYQLAVDQVIF